VSDVGTIGAVDWIIDGGPPTLLGPEFTASNTNNWESHTVTEIVSLGPGVHTIQPAIRVDTDFGSPGTFSLFFRCLAVESRTE
jgi:hypothetical protein